MPEVFRLRGYKIFFFANEGNEPPHVHVSKNSASSSKIWLEPLEVAHNKANIPQKDLRRVLDWLTAHKGEVIALWQKFFNS